MKEKEMQALSKEMFFAMSALALTDSVIGFILRLFGIDIKPDPLVGYEYFYCYNAGDGIYIHGYRHTVKKDVKLFASWDWRNAVKNKFRDTRPQLNHKIAVFLINQGRKVERAMQEANKSLGSEIINQN